MNRSQHPSKLKKYLALILFILILFTQTAYAYDIEIKTVDTRKTSDQSIIDIYSGQYVDDSIYRLYRDPDLTKPVYFTTNPNHGKTHYAYTEDNSNATQDLNNLFGIIYLNNMPEGTYYLTQKTTPENYPEFKKPIEIKIQGMFAKDAQSPLDWTPEPLIQTDDIISSVELTNLAPKYASTRNTLQSATLILDYGQINKISTTTQIWTTVSIAAVAIAVTCFAIFKQPKYPDNEK